MNEFVIVHVGTLYDLDRTKLYAIYELQGSGAYEVPDLWTEYGIRNDPCGLEEACARMSLLLDKMLSDHLIPQGVLP